MVKSIMLAASVLAAGSAMAGANDSYEACTFEGPCLIRVSEKETGKAVFLVTEKDASLQYIWGDGWEFWLVSETEYDLVRDAIPEGQRFTVPAKEPTTGRTLAEVEKKGSASGGSQPQQPAGPLIGGTITVTVGGGNGNCTDCHKGSHYDIHKQVLKPQGGK